MARVKPMRAILRGAALLVVRALARFPGAGRPHRLKPALQTASWNRGRSLAAATLTLTMLIPTWQPTSAAELRLRPRCECSGALVTLGDIAEIFAADQRQRDDLAAIELIPVPPASRQQHISLREIQDLLLMRGLNLTEHRFSGASQVAILAGGEQPGGDPQRPVSEADSRRANRRLQEAVTSYLKQQNNATDNAWTVDTTLTPAQARLLSAADRSICVSGGAPPWTGTQRFSASIASPEEAESFAFEAQVSEPQAIAAAVRALPRGAVIRATDVQLQPVGLASGRAEGFTSLDAVIGQETNRAIAAGHVIERAAVQAPLLVRRGDAVTVCARSAGICVRTTARARDDGSLGDLIAVESMLDRTSYFARVNGVREVEVYGRAVRADQAAAARQSRPLRR